MDQGSGGGGSRAQAERWLGVAEKLLGARDLLASKTFAERAMDLDPLLDGVDQILAVADVLIAAQRRVNNQVDWYSILQLDPSHFDPAAAKRQYRRLALLLHPDRNSISGADIAFRLVADAWGILSDPSKKSLFDNELKMSAASGDPPAFWTACSSCCHVHQYAAEYRNRKLRCPTCQQPFTASEIAAPPVVPGTDMYYSTWGFFPLGFPGGPAFNALGTDAWKPFHPMAPQPTVPLTGGMKEEKNPNPNPNPVEKEPEPKWTAPVRNRKKMARKKVGSAGPKKFQVGVGGTATKGGTETGEVGKLASGININEEVKMIDIDEEEFVGLGGAEMGNINIDLDATEELLGNLQDIPFLKDDEIHMQIP